MKNSNLLVGGALIILVIGIVMYKKSQKANPADGAAATPAPASPAAQISTAVCPQPGTVAMDPVPSSTIVRGTQIMDSGTTTEMQTFIR